MERASNREPMQDVLSAAVIGHPIRHSKSPLIHNFWLKNHGLPGLYSAFDVAPSDLASFMDLAPRLGLAGFNVTIPHKEAVASLVSEMTPAAAQAGVVNTVVVRPDGSTLGDSTDGFGFLANLDDATQWSAADAHVAMIGAGGAARSVVAALLDAGASKIVLSNRTAAKAEALRMLDPARVETAPWPPTPEFFDRASLLVNASSLGMAGGPDWRWELPKLQPGTVATDLIYAPLETPFLKAAAASGARCVDGLGMLLHQAAPGFEQWFGLRPEVTGELRELVLDRKGWLP
ncbi:MAG: shikimate dehydrogenase [Pseudomonadota bacterium]